MAVIISAIVFVVVIVLVVVVAVFIIVGPRNLTLKFEQNRDSFCFVFCY